MPYRSVNHIQRWAFIILIGTRPLLNTGEMYFINGYMHALLAGVFRSEHRIHNSYKYFRRIVTRSTDSTTKIHKFNSNVYDDVWCVWFGFLPELRHLQRPMLRQMFPLHFENPCPSLSLWCQNGLLRTIWMVARMTNSGKLFSVRHPGTRTRTNIISSDEWKQLFIILQLYESSSKIV